MWILMVLQQGTIGWFWATHATHLCEGSEAAANKSWLNCFCIASTKCTPCKTCGHQWTAAVEWLGWKWEPSTNNVWHWLVHQKLHGSTGHDCCLCVLFPTTRVFFVSEERKGFRSYNFNTTKGRFSKCLKHTITWYKIVPGNFFKLASFQKCSPREKDQRHFAEDILQVWFEYCMQLRYATVGVVLYIPSFPFRSNLNCYPFFFEKRKIRLHFLKQSH